MSIASHRSPLAVLAACAVCAAALTGCAARSADTTTTVTVRIARAVHPASYEVELHRAAGSFRAVHTMRSGEQHTFAVPKGWLTVRVPGLCVVPTPGRHHSVVEVGPDTCTID